MSGKVFGVTWGVIALVLITAVVVQMYGSKIPGLNKIGAS